MRKIFTAVTGCLIALSAGAGLASASPMSAAEVQEMISSQLAAQGGTPPAAVVCPADLLTDVGSEITCAVTIGEETRGVTVTVVSVDNGQLNFSMKLARQ